jgi:hypothetical protein
VIGFADGVGVIFVKTDVGIFMMEHKSGRKRKVRKVSDPEDCCGVIPFMSFYTPCTMLAHYLDVIPQIYSAKALPSVTAKLSLPSVFFVGHSAKAETKKT